MRCCFPGCGRGVGLRRYCKAHTVWVGYLQGLKHRDCGATCSRRGKERTG